MLSTRWIVEFPTIDDLTERALAIYLRRRLSEVRGKTVRNESSALRNFVGWLKASGRIKVAPAVLTIRAHVTGTPFRQRRRVRAPELSPEEVARFLVALPRRSPTGFWVRDRLVVAFETTLRPATIARLAAPQNYSKGATTLILTNEDDKEQYGRELPLTTRARSALDRCCPTDGLIFGKHEMHPFVRPAAAATLPAHKASILCAQHLRSAGITRLLETSANLPGVQMLAGHKLASTTSRYSRTSLRAANAVIEAADRNLGHAAGERRKRARNAR